MSILELSQKVDSSTLNASTDKFYEGKVRLSTDFKYSQKDIPKLEEALIQYEHEHAEENNFEKRDELNEKINALQTAIIEAKTKRELNPEQNKTRRRIAKVVNTALQSIDTESALYSHFVTMKNIRIGNKSEYLGERTWYY